VKRFVSIPIIILIVFSFFQVVLRGNAVKATDDYKWVLVSDIFTNFNVVSLAIDPSNPSIIYSGRFGISKSMDGGSSWKDIGLTNFSMVDSLAIDPKNTSIIYAGTENGVWKSTNGGSNWIQTGLTDIHIDSLAIDHMNTQVIYAGTRDGIYKSTNGGINWTQIDNGLPNNPYVYSLAIDPTNSKTIYMGTWWLWSGGGVFKSIDGGTNWTQINTGLTNTHVDSLAIDPTNTQVIYAGTFGGGVFKSTDGGSSWSAINNGLINLNVYTLAINPKNTQIIYAGTDDGIFKLQPASFIITTSAGTGGYISPSGTTTVNYGDSKTFTITPSSGYKISNVKVDGVSKSSISSYTFTNITSNHTIEAIFKEEKKETVIILQISNSTFTVNGISNTLDSPPVIKNSRTLLPIRAIIEALGGTVSWDANARKVTVTLGSTTIELWIGKSTAKVNSVDTPIDSTNSKVVPEIINSRTMLPLRFVTENLGCDVQWDGATKTITITYAGS
jgi:hypothetical protein